MHKDLTLAVRCWDSFNIHGTALESLVHCVRYPSHLLVLCISKHRYRMRPSLALNLWPLKTLILCYFRVLQVLALAFVDSCNLNKTKEPI